MERFSKRFSLQQLVYRSVTFDDGVSLEHNAVIRVKLVGALLESEVGQVLEIIFDFFDPKIIMAIIIKKLL